MHALISLPLIASLWAPLGPMPVPADTLQTKTGENFSGKLVGMHKGKVKFESAAGGELDVEWSDVSSLVTDNIQEVVLNDGTKQKHKFGEGADLALSSIRAINPESGPPKWEAELNLGASQSLGNSEITQIVLTSKGLYRLEGKDRITGDFTWLYSEEKDQDTKIKRITQRRTAGSLQYDHFLDEKLYAYARISAESDKQQDLQLRVQPGAGAGYQIHDNEISRWSAEAGLVWRYEDYERASPEDTMAARLATSYWRQVLDNLEYAFDFEWTPSLEDGSDHYAQMRNAFSTDFGSGIKGGFAWEWDYDTTPAAGNERSDHRFFLTIGIKL